MYRRALQIAVAALLTMAPSAAIAQAVVQPTAAPLVTAENQPWYRDGSTIDWNGGSYSRAGAPRAFDPSTMTLAGSYRGIWLYIDTSRESESVVLVPIDGGRVQPYELLSAPVPVATTGCVSPTGEPAPAALGTSGRTSPTGRTNPTNRSVESAVLPKGINNAWIDFDGARWVADGKATARTADLNVIGEHAGFPVFARGSDRSTIYVPSTADLVVPFTRKQ